MINLSLTNAEAFALRDLFPLGPTYCPYLRSVKLQLQAGIGSLNPEETILSKADSPVLEVPMPQDWDEALTYTCPMCSSHEVSASAEYRVDFYCNDCGASWHTDESGQVMGLRGGAIA